MSDETIDEIFEGVDLTVEYVTIELVDGEKVTMKKSEYEQLLKDYAELGEIFY